MGIRYTTKGIARITGDPKTINRGAHIGVTGVTDKDEKVFFYAEAEKMMTLIRSGWRRGVAGVKYIGERQTRLFSRMAWVRLDVEGCIDIDPDIK